MSDDAESPLVASRAKIFGCFQTGKKSTGPGLRYRGKKSRDGIRQKMCRATRQNGGMAGSGRKPNERDLEALNGRMIFERILAKEKVGR